MQASNVFSFHLVVHRMAADLMVDDYGMAADLMVHMAENVMAADLLAALIGALKTLRKKLLRQFLKQYCLLQEHNKNNYYYMYTSTPCHVYSTRNNNSCITEKTNK